VTRFRFVEQEAAQFPVSLLCRVVGVTRQGYYAWRRRPPSARELADRVLAERVKAIHAETEEIYGAPRIYSELKLVDGIAVGKKRVARLMRQLGIRGADGRRGGFKTTVRDPKRDSAPDLVDRDFARAEPNRLWVCDLKYIQTGQGFLFLAAVQDVFSRRIIGWSMRDDLKAELVLDALGMAVTARGADTAGVVAHSDHGSQYVSLAYGAYAKQSGIDLSMGSIGDPRGQRPRRELLRLARERAPAPRALHHSRAGPAADLLVHRMLLQPPPQALQPRHAQPDRLRTATPTGGHRGLTTRCQQKRVTSNAASTTTTTHRTRSTSTISPAHTSQAARLSKAPTPRSRRNPSRTSHEEHHQHPPSDLLPARVDTSGRGFL
jgi:putative transposase